MAAVSLTWASLCLRRVHNPAGSEACPVVTIRLKATVYPRRDSGPHASQGASQASRVLVSEVSLQYTADWGLRSRVTHTVLSLEALRSGVGRAGSFQGLRGGVCSLLSPASGGLLTVGISQLVEPSPPSLASSSRGCLYLAV